MTKRLTYLLCFLAWLTLPYQALGSRQRQRYTRNLRQSDFSTTIGSIIEAPANNESINSSEFKVVFDARSSVDEGLSCRLEVDGQLYRNWVPCTSPVFVQLHDDGWYTFQVMVGRSHETDDPVDQRNWLLDRMPPNTTILSRPDDNRNVRPQFRFTAQDARSPISHYECKLDQHDWHRCESPYNLPVLDAGLHIFRVKAFDAAGNVDLYPAQYNWTIPPGIIRGGIGTASLLDSDETQALSDRRDSSEGASSPSDSSNDDIVSQTKSNWLMSLLILVFALIGLFFLSFGLYKVCMNIRQRAIDQDGDGGGSQLTSCFECEMLPGGIDMSGFSSIMAASWPEHLRRFRYEELWAATGGFPEKGILGEGGFGKVYSGTLEDGQPVAVKKLEHNGQQGDREFFVEVAALCRARHLNILRLVGVCIENGNRVCVFELMDWGSARSLLDDADPRFTWGTRLRVAIGAARGLACLHEGVDPPIVHRDLKSENILMDQNGEARISDFGLCTLSHHEARQRHLRHNVTMTVGTICGTFGYLAPEVSGAGRVSTKSDVYAFGVFLLELLTGRRPIETARDLQEQNLVKWTLRHIDRMDRIREAVDPLISCDVSFVQITAFVELAASCLHFSPSNRPSASEAACRLEEIMSFREQLSQHKKEKEKMDELCIAPRLSETSGTIPTGFRISCPSEGELTPHALNTPIASTSSGRMTEVELLQRRFQDSALELPSPQEPQEIFSPTHREHGNAPGPSSNPDVST